MRITTVAEKFYSTVKIRWPFAKENGVLETIEAVIQYLRNRLPPKMENRLVLFLPENLATVSSLQISKTKERKDGHPVVNGDAEELLQSVCEKGKFPNLDMSRSAAIAVLATLIEHLPAQESLQIRTQLPKGIQLLWAQAVQFDGFLSFDMGLFHRNMEPLLFPGHDIASIDIAVKIVVNALIHRIGVGEEKNILPHVPEEIRIAIGHLTPHALGEEFLILPISADTLLKKVKTGAGLKDIHDARHTVVAVFHALKSTGVARDSTIENQLPLDWQELWNAA